MKAIWKVKLLIIRNGRGGMENWLINNLVPKWIHNLSTSPFPFAILLSVYYPCFNLSNYLSLSPHFSLNPSLPPSIPPLSLLSKDLHWSPHWGCRWVCTHQLQCSKLTLSLLSFQQQWTCAIRLYWTGSNSLKIKIKVLVNTYGFLIQFPVDLCQAVSKKLSLMLPCVSL